MRMWMVPVEELCSVHLIAEHASLHAFMQMIKDGRDIEGYIIGNELSLCDLGDRHEQLAKEMGKRGMHHRSDFDFAAWRQCLQDLPPHLVQRSIDPNMSNRILHEMCTECGGL